MPPAKEDTQVKAKLASFEKEIGALQRSISNLSEQINQSVNLLGNMRLEFDAEKAKTESLKLSLEKVYTHLNEKRI